MCLGISIGTGLAIGGGLTAATSLYGAKKQSDAAQQASQQQQAAAQQALQQTSPLYQQALQIAQQQAAQGQARLDPYAQQGGAGLTALSAFLGVPAPSAANPALSASAATPAQQASANAAIPNAVPKPANPTAVPWSTTPGDGLVEVRSRGGQTGYVPLARLQDTLAAGATPTDPSLTNAGGRGVPQTPGPYATPAMLQARGITPGSAADVVLLQAPDGSRLAVPRAHAPALLAKGATMVG